MESSETAYEGTDEQQADASDSERADASGSSADDTGDDTSSYSETLIKVAPIIVYACVFYARLKNLSMVRPATRTREHKDR